MISFRKFMEAQGPTQAMPAWIYHVTPSPDAVMRTGHFIPASKLGISQQVFGGASSDAVSFTTQENAENYQEGLEIYRQAAMGAYQWKDQGMMYEIAAYYGLNHATFDQIRKEMDQWLRQSGETDNQHIISEFLSKVSFYSFLNSRKTKGSRFLPLVLRQGAAFPPSLASSKGVAILAISPRPGNGKSGPQKVQWVPTEQEWKVYDPENFDYTTLKMVSNGIS